MPYKYTRKSTQQSWSAEAMKEAILAVKRDKMPFATAAKQFNVPRNTLKRRVLEKNRDATDDKKILGKYRMVFTDDQELELCQHIIDMEQRFYGVTQSNLRNMAYSLATKNNIPHTFNEEKKMAGKDWLAGFKKRHPHITLRSPEATSLARAQGFNKVNVTKFFDILKSVLDNQEYPAHRIYNCDETGLLTVQSRHSKVFALKGRRQVGAITSAERGLLSTFEVCMSAGGTFIPPFVIFPRKNMKAELGDGAPPGSKFACTPSGWMQTDIFLKWFDHFLEHAKPSKEAPVVLILDGHATHTKSIDFINKARENHTTVICLPPHCSHKLQPLDVSFMAPFKAYYIQECEKFLRNNPGRAITQFQISRLMGEAFLRAAVPTTAISGFRKCGIFPFNPEVFVDADFLAAEVTDIPVNDSQHDEDLNPIRNQVDPSLEENEDQETPNKRKDPNNEDLAVAGPSGVGLVKSVFKVLSPRDIVPLPKQSMMKKRRENRKRGKTAIITASPYKYELEEEIKKRQEEESKKRKRADLKKQTQKTKTSIQIKKRLSFDVEEESEEGDVEEDCLCFYCNEPFSRSKDNEGWIMCSLCKQWAHQECAGCEEEDDDFQCEYCKMKKV